MLKTYIIFISLFFISFEVSSAYPQTDFDFSLLPPYCKAKLNPSSPAENKLWRSKLGSDFLHTHHYCAALHTLRLVKNMHGNSKREKMLKTSALGAVFTNIEYMEKHAKPAYVLFPFIYTTKAEAYFEAGKETEALQYLIKATSVKTTYTRPFGMLADYYLKQGKTQDAKDILEKGLSYSPNSMFIKKRINKISN